MAYKMKGFSYPGASPMKQSKFPNSTKALNRKKNKPSDDKDESLKTNQNIQLNEVSVGGEKTEQKERKIVQAQQIPITSEEPVPKSADYTPIATANKNKKSRAKFRSDVGSFIDGLAGIPEDIVEGVADAGGWVAKGIGNKAKTIKANRLARKQDKIDNPKPEKVKKEKVTTNKDKKTKRKSKVDGIDPTNDTGMVTKVVNGVKTSVKAKDRFNDESSNRVKKTKPKSKVAENLGKTLKGAGGMIGEQLITQGISAGIQALLTPKEKEQRDRSNPNLGGFSQMKFGRRPMKE